MTLTSDHMPIFALYERDVGEQFQLWRTVESYEEVKAARQEYSEKRQSGERTGKLRTVPFPEDEEIPEQLPHENELNNVYEKNCGRVSLPDVFN